MKFSTLADYFEKLEAETKRNELVQILSELFKKSSPAEIPEIAYLIQGRVAPFFEATEIGMAEKMVEQAISAAYDLERDEVKKLATKRGDQGIAAGELNKKKGIKDKGLTVSEVFKQLRKIAETSGEGSVETKIGLLVSLLKQIGPESAKHLVRVPLGKTRLGIGDPTVLDSLSFAKVGDKSLRKDLEEAYNKTSDLGFVAETFWSKGLKAIKAVELIIGKPVRPALAERLPDAEAVVKRMGEEFAVEPKFDGFRCQVHKEGEKVRIFSRNLEDFTSSFPDLVEGVKTEVAAKSFILEGEAIAYNPLTKEFLPFQETTKRRRKYGVEEAAEKAPLKLFCFDLLYLNGKDITGEPYVERRKKLKELIKDDSQTIMEAVGKMAHKADDLTKQFEEAISEGLEGVMIKRLDSTYQAGARNFNWIKFKRQAGGELEDSVDCVILGYFYGTGKRTNFGVGGLFLGVYDDKADKFLSISRLGTGLTDEEFRTMKTELDKIKVFHKPARVEALIEPSVWVEPRLVAEIFADEITRSPIHTAGKDKEGIGYALRFPRLVKFRGSDKRAEDATTVKEIEQMFQAQKKVKVS
ncbi:MAG: ATP-dependent DNA ligase [bacterium]|nr:ATP-dependent DNA ligase [bacterium]